MVSEYFLYLRNFHSSLDSLKIESIALYNSRVFLSILYRSPLAISLPFGLFHTLSPPHPSLCLSIFRHLSHPLLFIESTIERNYHLNPSMP